MLFEFAVSKNHNIFPNTRLFFHLNHPIQWSLNDLKLCGTIICTNDVGNETQIIGGDDGVGVMRQSHPRVILQPPILRKSGYSQFCNGAGFYAVRDLQGDVGVVRGVFVVYKNHRFIVDVFEGERGDFCVGFVFEFEMAAVGLDDVHDELLWLAIGILNFNYVS